VTYTTKPFDEYLDLPAYRGQRVERFRYRLVNGVTGLELGYVTPLKDSVPRLTHNTGQTIKRQLDIALGVADTALVNTLTDRIAVTMEVGGTEYPLGRYMFTDDSVADSTGGERGSYVLLDESFTVDQQLEHATTGVGSAHVAILKLLTDFTFRKDVAASDFNTTTTFGAGQSRGQALDTYATQGDYFPFWMDHNGAFRMVRTIDPALVPATFDFDVGKKVLRDSPVRSSDVLTAPNKFIVISNSGATESRALVGTYEVPPSAPHSIAQRGFTIPDVRDVQALTDTQASAMARNIGIRATVFERYTLTTALDPRHDSYDVIHWRGDNWLELAWSMELVAGGQMQHTIRKAYAP
jgi:hypothetical protein